MTTPTDTEIAERLARFMGWERAEGAGYHGFKHWWRGDPKRRICEVWHPCESLDQMAEVESEIERKAKFRLYVRELMGDGFNNDSLSHLFKLACASARDRALAAYWMTEGMEKS